jgi:hypothetical protein
MSSDTSLRSLSDSSRLIVFKNAAERRLVDFFVSVSFATSLKSTKNDTPLFGLDDAESAYIDCVILSL